MKNKLFGTDGIRGPANSEKLAPENIVKLGISAGCFAKRQSNSKRPRVVIGKDTRDSSYTMEASVVAGLTRSGVDVILLGPLPTPATSWLTRSLRADLGIMITASHNPHTDNGFKFFDHNGCKLDTNDQNRIEHLFYQKSKDLISNENLHFGTVSRIEVAHGRYVEAVKNCLNRHTRLSGLKIVLDCANGAAYRCGPEVLWELGAEVITIGTTPDGQNINHECGATNTKALRSRVIAEGADIGIALDGDADRLIVCDELGQEISGDQILAFLASKLHRENRLDSQKVAVNMMSNSGLDAYLQSLGIGTVRTKVGDRQVAKALEDNQLSFGGENSGHIILTEHACTGDGLVAALQVLSELASSDQTASTLLSVFKEVPKLTQNVRYDPVKNPLDHEDTNKKIVTMIKEFTIQGQIIVRQSGTEPMIRIQVESENPDVNKEKMKELLATLSLA